MSFIKIDPTLVSQLGSSREAVTLCGPDGVPLGMFTPFQSPCGPRVDDAEIDRRMADKSRPRHTTAEVLDRLAKLGGS